MVAEPLCRRSFCSRPGRCTGPGRNTVPPDSAAVLMSPARDTPTSAESGSPARSSGRTILMRFRKIACSSARARLMRDFWTCWTCRLPLNSSPRIVAGSAMVLNALKTLGSKPSHPRTNRPDMSRAANDTSGPTLSGGRCPLKSGSRISGAHLPTLYCGLDFAAEYRRRSFEDPLAAMTSGTSALFTPWLISAVRLFHSTCCGARSLSSNCCTGPLFPECARARRNQS